MRKFKVCFGIEGFYEKEVEADNVQKAVDMVGDEFKKVWQSVDFGPLKPGEPRFVYVEDERHNWIEDVDYDKSLY